MCATPLSAAIAVDCLDLAETLTLTCAPLFFRRLRRASKVETEAHTRSKAAVSGRAKSTQGTDR